MFMERGVVERRVRRSVARFLDHDSYLLEVDAQEESVSHKLAEYLQQEFPNWNVDCEFNKYYGETKTLDEYDKDWVRPDIIIHQRGTDEDLLVIEIKLTTSDDDICLEKRKVRLYTEDEELEYKYGLFLHLESDSVPGVEEETWYPEE